MFRLSRLLFFIVIGLHVVLASARCEMSDAFATKLNTLKWVTYAPTNFNPEQNDFPSEDSLRDDLALLYAYGFRGIVTYGSDMSLAEIPRIAAETGFEGIIMGIWDINNPGEMKNAIAAKEYVDGYCVGNEGLNARYTLESLKEAIEKIKRATSKPTATTEQINDYYNIELDLLNVGDWIFPNIHPFLNRVREPQKAVQWLQKHFQLLTKHANGKIVLVKEAGFPTAGMPMASEINQVRFFAGLQKTEVRFVYFEAFDQPWKTSLSVEPHWGLFNLNRKPKKFISTTCH